MSSRYTLFLRQIVCLITETEDVIYSDTDTRWCSLYPIRCIYCSKSLDVPECISIGIASGCIKMVCSDCCWAEEQIAPALIGHEPFINGQQTGLLTMILEFLREFKSKYLSSVNLTDEKLRDLRDRCSVCRDAVRDILGTIRRQQCELTSQFCTHMNFAAIGSVVDVRVHDSDSDEE